MTARQYVLPRLTLILLIGLLSAAQTFPQLTPKEQSTQLSSFETVWLTVRDHNPDPQFNGLNWQAIHDAFKPRIQSAKSIAEVRDILRDMIGKLGVSHYAILSSDLYSEIAPPSPVAAAVPSGIETVVVEGKSVIKTVAPDSPAARAGVRAGMVVNTVDGASLPAANAELNDSESRRLALRAINQKLSGAANAPVKLDLIDADGKPKQVVLSTKTDTSTAVQFGNLPGVRVQFESRLLPGGAGYIRFNEFLDPVNLMPKFETALHDFAHAPGVILDLRGNPGGIGIMAMGLAGFFIEDSGRQLGEMKMRGTTLKFTVFPRAETYPGKVAILLDEGSASTAEIFAQGMQDLKRARIFGTRSAGAALPSDIIRLPNGDGFQYPTASYTSSGGRVLEGNGVIPDVEVRQNRGAIAAGRDLVIDAAAAWIGQ